MLLVKVHHAAVVLQCVRRNHESVIFRSERIAFRLAVPPGRRGPLVVQTSLIHNREIGAISPHQASGLDTSRIMGRGAWGFHCSRLDSAEQAMGGHGW
jgi:hypothetical protein